MNPKKKHILKPGMHQFAPKSPPVHSNENLTDEEAEWYLEKYPHIKSLFEPGSKSVKSKTLSVESKDEIGVIQPEIGVITTNNNEDLPATN